MTSSYAGKPALLVPVLTPFKAGYEPDAERFAAHCRSLLAEGAHGLAVFGTTSEANSLSVAERAALLERLVQSGANPAALMPGCGCCALPDAVQLVRQALELGCAGTLVLPPFFYRAATGDGVLAWYGEVIERVGDARLRLYLYHFPQMSGLPITPALIEQLLKRYPDVVAGVKDSAGVWSDTETLITSFPALDVYSGSEAFLLRNLRAGGAGCISATANANVAAIRALIDRRDSPEAEQLHDRLCAVRSAFEAHPMIPALKAYVAAKLQDAQWAVPRPPLLELPAQNVQALLAQLAGTNLAAIRPALAGAAS